MIILTNYTFSQFTKANKMKKKLSFNSNQTRVSSSGTKRLSNALALFLVLVGKYIFSIIYLIKSVTY